MFSKFDTNPQSDELTAADLYEAQAAWEADQADHEVEYEWTEEAIAGLDPSKSYYLYCRSGNRSGQAAKLLRDKGFESVFNAGAYGSLEGL